MKRRHLVMAALALAAALWFVATPARSRRASLSDTEGAARTIDPHEVARTSASKARVPTASVRNVEGRVMDPEGQPITGALISFNAVHADAVRSDAGGSFRLPSVPTSGVQIYAVATGHAPRHLWLEPERKEIILVLSPEARVRVRLGAPAVSSLLASVCHPRDSEQEEPFCVGRVIVTARESVFEMGGLPAGAYELWLEEGERVLFRSALATRAGATVEVRAAASAFPVVSGLLAPF